MPRFAPDPDLEAPGLMALRRALGAHAPVLLSSAAAGSQGRFDLLPLAEGEPIVVPYPGKPGHASALAALQTRLRSINIGNDHGDEASAIFSGGWILYLAYEFGSVFEPKVRAHDPEIDEPLAILWRAPAAVIHDRSTDQRTLAGTLSPSMREGYQRALAASQVAAETRELPLLTISEDPGEQFLDGVKRVHAYLRAGDVFQVNLSRAWRVTSAADFDADDLFERLCAANPAPFAALLKHAGWALVSSSPERLVSVRGRLVQTRPIAGTRRRDPNPQVDAELLAELKRDPKERAEHIMLIDLERNDLGRICAPGSIVVDELGGVESYAHVHHLVSNVSGRLRSGMDAWTLLSAVFPGGTITGCPKVRCMQIISELEPSGRGAYTGSLGYLGDDGVADFNILIRTLSVRANEIVLRAGAGIVADSVAGRELAETRAKARGMLRALGVDG